MRYNFLLCGQSNMSGRGALTDLVGNEFPNAERVFVYGNDGAWHNPGVESVDDPANQVDARSLDVGPGVGPGMAFANRMAELLPNDEIGLVPCAKGSEAITMFRRFWVRDSLHGSAIMRAYDAASAGVTAGLLFWQGEAETLDAMKAAQWRENFSNVMAAMRVDLCRLDLPIVFARLNNLNPANHPYWNDVRGGQDDIRMNKVAMVSTDLAATLYQADKVHCTTAGYLQVGARFADAMFALL